MNCSDEKIKRTPCQLLRHFRLRASDTGMAKDNQLFGFFYFLLTFACSPQWRRQGLGKLVIVFLCSVSSLRLGKAVLKNLLLGIIAAEFTVARDIMKQALGGRTLRLVHHCDNDYHQSPWRIFGLEWPLPEQSSRRLGKEGSLVGNCCSFSPVRSVSLESHLPPAIGARTFTAAGLLVSQNRRALLMVSSMCS